MMLYDAIGIAAQNIEHWRIEKAGIWAIVQDYDNAWYRLGPGQLRPRLPSLQPPDTSPRVSGSRLTGGGVRFWRNSKSIELAALEREIAPKWEMVFSNLAKAQASLDETLATLRSGANG